MLDRADSELRYIRLPDDRDGPVGAPRAVRRMIVTQVTHVDYLAALLGLLHRYSHQTRLALDLFLIAPDGVSAMPLDVSVEGGTSVSALIAVLTERLAAPPEAVGTRANIALTFARESSCDADRGYDINIVIAPSGGGTDLTVWYDASAFAADMIERLLDSYLVILGALNRDPGSTIDHLPLLTPAVIAALTDDPDISHAADPSSPSYILFQSWAARHPDAPAVFHRTASLTYGELDRRSSRLAHYLLANAIAPEIPVAVCLKPSVESLVAILAIWKARGLYLPLDPTHPRANIQRMLEEAQPRLVLIDSALAHLTEGFRQFCFDQDIGQLEAYPDTAPATESSPDDAAYLFYTSGTTGKPKGVIASHANLTQYVQSAIREYGFCRDDVFVSVARATFSISLFELISPLCCGASVRLLDRDEILAPERLCLALDAVTVLHAGPSLLGSVFRHLQTLPDAMRTLPNMRHASTGGDIVPPSVMAEMQRAFPNAELFVIYGCTEVSCMGTSYPIVRDVEVSRSFVGKPFPNVTLRVFDTQRQLVPFGVVGEICFAGPGIARGYLKMPELTEEKFVELDGQRFYQTGDLGRLHPDGNLEILGRRDFQVQLRGIRIELASIEQQVVQLGLASQCLVIAKTMVEGADARLVAFVVKPTVETITAFRQTLARELPDYMLPHHVVVLEAPPLTANGKVDRQRLREIPWTIELTTAESASANDALEQSLADCFAEVLGQRAIGIDDNFFERGGDSLLGILLLDTIKQALGVTLSPEILFEHGTVRSIADHLRRDAGSVSGPVLLNGTKSAQALFMLSGIHSYRALAQHLTGKCAAYGVVAPREIEAFGDDVSLNTVGCLAREYVGIIRAQQPTGPYRLLGYSFSGLVAYEVARLLRDAGEIVEFLALIDTDLPEESRPWRHRFAQLLRLPTASPRAVLAYLWHRHIEGYAPKFLMYRNHQKLAPLEARREAVNRAAAVSYFEQLQPTCASLVLITAGRRLREEPLRSRSCGWRRYVRALSVHSVDCDHFQMMRDEPYISEVARILSGELARIAPSPLARCGSLPFLP
jgi:amino acid adenylation domain-containing protein